MDIDSPSKLSLKERLTFLMKDTLLYGGAAAFNKAFALITFPILARYFSVNDYGVIDYFNVLSALGVTLFIFGQDSAVARYFYEDEEKEKRSQIISQSLFFQISMIVTLIPILWLSVDTIAPILNDSEISILLLKLILLRVPFMVLINFSQNLLKWTFNRLHYIILSIGSVLTNLLMILIAIFYFKIDVTGVFIVSLITNVIFGMIGIWYIREWLVIPKKLNYLAKLLKFGLPLGFLGVMTTFVPAMERNIIAKMLGSHDLGLYAAGTKIAMLVMLIVQAFQMSWGPFSLAIYKKPDAPATYNWILKIFTISICIIVLLLTSVANSLIVFLASEEYSGASVVVFPIAMGLSITAISWITEIGIGISKKSYLNIYGQLAYFIATIFVIYLLTPVLGLFGVALGVLVGHILKAVIASSLAQKAYSLPWEYNGVLVVVMLTIIMGILGGFLFNNTSSTPMYYFLFSITLILSLGWVLLLSKSERAVVINYFRERKQDYMA